MSTEISIPFRLDKFGSVATTEDPNEQARQHVKSIVATEPGERVQMPTYGVPTKEFMFAPGVDKVSSELYRDIVTQIGAWEPTIEVLGVTPSASNSLGIAPVEVDFTQSFTPADQLLSATVQVGGTVVQE